MAQDFGDTGKTLEHHLKKHPQHDYSLASPLAGISGDELRRLARMFVDDHDLKPACINELSKRYKIFEKGALLAQNSTVWEGNETLGFTAEEKACLAGEVNNKWSSQPRQLYGVIILISMCAAVQGWNEAAVNGANSLYRLAFGLDDEEQPYTWKYGLVNSAPYLCCVFSCWLTEPMNNWFGRRGTLFITCLISCAACLGQGFTQTWQQMLAARFLLGFGIGPKSATAPIYAAECAPESIRGSLVMMWQMWTAFGIMLGLASGVVFYNAGSATSNKICTAIASTKSSARNEADYRVLLSTECSLNWRLMIASPMVLAIIVCMLVYLCPESPRWYMMKKNYRRAFASLQKLRKSELQAARDLFYIHCYLYTERELTSTGRNRFVELFTEPRNRRAVFASTGLMFLQQFCGVNILAYYSTDILFQANRYVYSTKALLTSLGFGLINFVFALPAVYTIDSFGRRNLLLSTFPIMAVFMLVTSMGFIHENQPNEPLVIVGMYLFAMSYSPGEGPVPFTYAAECFPLINRNLGMALATAVLWFFNFILAMTWPSMSGAMTTTGAFAFYSAWNVVGFFFVLLFVPETRKRSLEALDQVFEISTREHAQYGIRQARVFVARHVFGREVTMPVLRCDEPVRDDPVPKFYRNREMRAFPDEEVTCIGVEMGNLKDV